MAASPSPNFVLELSGSFFDGNEYFLEDIDPSIFDDPFLDEMTINPLQNNAVPATEVTLEPATSDEQPAKRFKTLSKSALETLSDQRFSKSTKKNSRWGFNVFQGSCDVSQLFLG